MLPGPRALRGRLTCAPLPRRRPRLWGSSNLSSHVGDTRPAVREVTRPWRAPGRGQGRTVSHAAFPGKRRKKQRSPCPRSLGSRARHPRSLPSVPHGVGDSTSTREEKHSQSFEAWPFRGPFMEPGDSQSGKRVGKQRHRHRFMSQHRKRATGQCLHRDEFLALNLEQRNRQKQKACTPVRREVGQHELGVPKAVATRRRRARERGTKCRPVSPFVEKEGWDGGEGATGASKIRETPYFLKREGVHFMILSTVQTSRTGSVRCRCLWGEARRRLLTREVPGQGQGFPRLPSCRREGPPLPSPSR
ncbi:uncharacterized protein LOC120619261 [Pteropus medius]|uniref:uncharacterized protein LOC120619261 n=1 Tax=Pteropus vampyrus TaxID=132908 RepID=UPI00196AAA9F|nr:uncharacterized protein LOC120619261 [Pteropus giganteus]XP_039739487.1 uncharacterized protein LOC120619261 [Pteropus giganteus]